MEARYFLQLVPYILINKCYRCLDLDITNRQGTGERCFPIKILPAQVLILVLQNTWQERNFILACTWLNRSPSENKPISVPSQIRVTEPQILLLQLACAVSCRFGSGQCYIDKYFCLHHVIIYLKNYFSLQLAACLWVTRSLDSDSDLTRSTRINS